MRYRITLTFFENPLVGETCQQLEFESPDDSVAGEHFQHEARSGWLHCGAMLHRINQQEVVTELQRLESDDLGDDESA